MKSERGLNTVSFFHTLTAIMQYLQSQSWLYSPIETWVTMSVVHVKLRMLLILRKNWQSDKNTGAQLVITFVAKTCLSKLALTAEKVASCTIQTEKKAPCKALCELWDLPFCTTRFWSGVTWGLETYGGHSVLFKIITVVDRPYQPNRAKYWRKHGDSGSLLDVISQTGQWQSKWFYILSMKRLHATW